MNRTALGVSGHNGGPSVEPVLGYFRVYSLKGSFNFGFEHPALEQYLEEASTLVDEEERWAKTAEMTKWMFDNVSAKCAIRRKHAVWPVGPRIDESAGDGRQRKLAKQLGGGAAPELSTFRSFACGLAPNHINSV